MLHNIHDMQCCIISMIGNAACVDWCCGQTPCHGISMNSEQWTTEQPLPRHLVSDKSENVPRFLCHGVAHLNGISATKIKERQRQSWNSTLQVGCSCTKVLVCKSCLFMFISGLLRLDLFIILLFILVFLFDLKSVSDQAAIVLRMDRHCGYFVDLDIVLG